MTFFSLGSGSCGNCYYLSTETDAIIIDCGVSLRRFKRIMLEYGMKVGKTRGILITHDHADHIKAAGKIGKECCIPVYATPLVHEGMDRNWQNSVKVPEEQRRTIDLGVPFQLGEFRIAAGPSRPAASGTVGDRRSRIPL